MSVTGIVLCGGRSMRMGADKASLPFGGETMLDRVVRLVRTHAGDVIVVARRDQATPPGVTVVHDPVEDLGPLAGIAAGLAASASELNIVVACDMPLISPAVLQRLLESIDDNDICVAMVGGHASALCGVYRSRVAVEARRLVESGERRLMALLDRVQTKRVDAAAFRDIDPNLDSFVSCNTPDEYQKMKRTSPIT
jgi:molybdopterin-guanine dinucleotide biosynthesis protein A